MVEATAFPSCDGMYNSSLPPSHVAWIDTSKQRNQWMTSKVISFSIDVIHCTSHNTFSHSWYCTNLSNSCKIRLCLSDGDFSFVNFCTSMTTSRCPNSKKSVAHVRISVRSCRDTSSLITSRTKRNKDCSNCWRCLEYSWSECWRSSARLVYKNSACDNNLVHFL